MDRLAWNVRLNASNNNTNDNLYQHIKRIHTELLLVNFTFLPFLLKIGKNKAQINKSESDTTFVF